VLFRSKHHWVTHGLIPDEILEHATADRDHVPEPTPVG